MDNKQLLDWLRIVELKRSVLNIAFSLNNDDNYTNEHATKALIEVADAVDSLEEIHLEDVERMAVETFIKHEKGSVIHETNHH
jgi:hypothetical protein